MALRETTKRIGRFFVVIFDRNVFGWTSSQFIKMLVLSCICVDDILYIDKVSKKENFCTKIDMVW